MNVQKIYGGYEKYKLYLIKMSVNHSAGVTRIKCLLRFQSVNITNFSMSMRCDDKEYSGVPTSSFFSFLTVQRCNFTYSLIFNIMTIACTATAHSSSGLLLESNKFYCSTL